MNLETRIYNAIRALVSDRVYPLHAPDDVARPYILVAPITTTGSYTLSQVGNNDRRRVQLDLYADSSADYDDFDALAKTVRFSLEAIGARLNDEGRDFEKDTGLYRARMDFYIWHRPAP